jgi:hypothetical protein
VRVTEIHYALSVRQRLIYVVAGVLMTGAGLLVWRSGGYPLIASPGLLLMVYFFLFSLFGSTIDGTGVRLRGIRRQHLDWNQVSEISTISILGSRAVRLHLGSGGTRTLRAPVTGPFQRDPDFEEKVHTIRQCWMHSTGQLAS